MASRKRKVPSSDSTTPAAGGGGGAITRARAAAGAGIGGAGLRAGIEERGGAISRARAAGAGVGLRAGREGKRETKEPLEMETPMTQADHWESLWDRHQIDDLVGDIEQTELCSGSAVDRLLSIIGKTFRKEFRGRTRTGELEGTEARARAKLVLDALWNQVACDESEQGRRSTAGIRKGIEEARRKRTKGRFYIGLTNTQRMALAREIGKALGTDASSARSADLLNVLSSLLALSQNLGLQPLFALYDESRPTNVWIEESATGHRPAHFAVFVPYFRELWERDRSTNTQEVLLGLFNHLVERQMEMPDEDFVRVLREGGVLTVPILHGLLEGMRLRLMTDMDRFNDANVALVLHGLLEAAAPHIGEFAEQIEALQAVLPVDWALSRAEIRTFRQAVSTRLVPELRTARGGANSNWLNRLTASYLGGTNVDVGGYTPPAEYSSGAGTPSLEASSSSSAPSGSF